MRTNMYAYEYVFVCGGLRIRTRMMFEGEDEYEEYDCDNGNGF